MAFNYPQTSNGSTITIPPEVQYAIGVDGINVKVLPAGTSPNVVYRIGDGTVHPEGWDNVSGNKYLDFYVSTGATGATGSQGDIGPQGAIGATGPQGDIGPQGAIGPAGPQGVQGPQGVSVTNVARTSGDGSPGTTDTYTITLSDANTFLFNVYQGSDGAGGDMFKSTYDSDNNGKVDLAENSERLGGVLASAFAQLGVAGTFTALQTFANIQFSGGTGTQGQMSWNTDEETVDLIQNGATLQLGQETQVHARNNTGSSIADGTVVYVTGTLGASGRITVAPAGTTDAKYIVGVTTETIADGEDGKVTNFGKVRGLDTSSYTEGSVLYVNTTDGSLTATKPTTGLCMPIAFVINSHATNGTLMVRTTPIDELEVEHGETAYGWGDHSVAGYAVSGHTHDDRYYTETETDSLLGAKQDAIVSGTHIKTVNGNSIVGSGDFDVDAYLGTVYEGL